MITDTGGGLSVLIVCEPEQDWQSFSTWYSLFKNLPDAKAAIVCHRNGQTPFVYYQWAKRLNIPVLYRTPGGDDPRARWLEAAQAAGQLGYVGPQVLVVRPLTVAVDLLDAATLDRLNGANTICTPEAWFMRGQDAGGLLDAFYLSGWRPEPAADLVVEANETEAPASLVRYEKGCGKWIHTARGCPFSSAAGLAKIGMTANENRIIELWKKMVPLYNAVN
jgi:hypothetical protein